MANKMKGKLEPSERQKLIDEGIGWKGMLVILSFLRLILLFELFFRVGKNLKEELLNLEEDLLKLTDELQQKAQCIPNMTHPDVRIGGEECATTIKTVFFSCFLTYGKVVF